MTENFRSSYPPGTFDAPGAPVKPPSALDFDAVVIGASAGGIDALNALLPALPPGFAATVLVVVHVRADSPTLLAQTFGPRCRLPVVEPDDKEAIIAGRIYVAPPAYHMQVEDDRTIALSADNPVRFSRPSIDVLFESAAWVWRERLLGIVLSGANDDGARGLAAVRAAGGTTWAQTPESAPSPEMPRAAIERNVIDEILDPQAMGLRLAGFTRPSNPSTP
jgi:two-component system chemotaxis response regulator CheB